jgi:hypothetical protein
MSDRQSIIGFTEAELGFFLALLCLILFVVAAANAAQSPAPLETKPTVSITADSMRKLLGDLEASNRRLANLEAQLDSLRDRRSRITPSCKEKGVAAGPLFTIAVVAPDRFILEGQTLSIQDVLAKTGANRAEAQRAGCVHEIRVEYLSSLSASELDQGWRLLDPEFRLLRAGPITP